ncbi:MAG: flotillin family protein [Vulcanimicrobiota bacterium]
MGGFELFIAGFGALVAFIIFWKILNLFKRCPSDKILVIFGKVGQDEEGGIRSARTIHGGGAIVWPIVQDYMYLDLAPITIDIPLKSALSKQNIRINVPSTFTVGITTDPEIMQNAAERLLGLGYEQIKDLAKDVIFGQLRVVIATMDIEEINADRDKFLANVMNNVDSELKKIGLKLINVNITDITDESGYIDALGQEAAAGAINEAKIRVAEKNRDGAVGQSEAKKDERIRVSNANALAVEGENLSKIKVADSEATRRERIAEAERKASAAEKVQSAQALEEAYAAEQQAELARAEKNRASRKADEIVPAEIQKQKVEIAAEAEAEKIRRIAKGDSDATYYKLAAQAKGNLEILTKQAEGLKEIVKAAGDDAQKAAMLMIVDKLPELVKTQVEAIKGINIDKVTVWDSGGDGKSATSTANFISGMMKSVPPLKDLFNLAGLELPQYLGKAKSEGEYDFSTAPDVSAEGQKNYQQALKQYHEQLKQSQKPEK